MSTTHSEMHVILLLASSFTGIRCRENLEKHTHNTSQNSDTCFYISYKRFSHAKDEPTCVSVRFCVHLCTFPNASLILVYAMYRTIKVCIFHTTPKRYIKN